MVEDERSYLQHRAKMEIERAQKATAPEAVRAHYQLAEQYLAKLAAFEPASAEAS